MQASEEFSCILKHDLHYSTPNDVIWVAINYLKLT